MTCAVAQIYCYKKKIKKNKKKTESDQLELVPAVQPDIEILAIYISDEYRDEYGDTAAIDVEIVMNELHIAENVGGGLHVSLLSKLPPGNIQLKLKGIAVVHNFLIQGTFQAPSYIVWFEGPMRNAYGVYTSLESVGINNNVFKN